MVLSAIVWLISIANAVDYDLSDYPHNTNVTNWYSLHWRVDEASKALKLALVAKSTVRN